ncbi:hypothetical protein BJF92_12105 [Rhizobium rhizosphaerae]|uniref:Rieske domain-containing protein n=1 Tax=Xaviernesmea rhizosphaerae TaxID=1672749 RepID=A0A1Q9AN11_9HYPH|nr:hypothetical protein [Xaviernesmea rhizosphaerae]OLP56807.1 hypothetical protein BJF92_12105 [Xaviernesmea rhizosphaerae]
MNTPRIETLSAAPEIGRYYLVPTVEGRWNDRLARWPVIGPRHSDAHCLQFDFQHYHLDPRFLVGNGWYWRSVQSQPLMISNRINPDGLPAPVWRRRKCQRLENPKAREFRADLAKRQVANFDCHLSEWAGRQARHDGQGWVCPHRNVPLASMPVIDGAILCPLHLLLIDARTGRVLPANAKCGVAP